MTENKHLKVDETSFPYIYLQHVDIPLKTYETGLVRCNVFLPKDSKPYGNRTYPVIATYGPYGKDVPYISTMKKSWDQLNPEMKSEHAAWETPDPLYWTQRGYIIVRVDERGAGQSPGKLDTMSKGTSEAFFDVVEWCAEQPWSSGKVGLLGISYYAGTQWRVAARRPKGLAAIIPWEGMGDYYRDRVRHGGILSDKFIARNYGPDPLDGELDDETLRRNRQDQTIDTTRYKYRDEEYYASKEYNLSDIEVPLLSVANWGGILLHLRGNVVGWLEAGSRYKFLRFVVGRHDLPFYYPHSAKLQESFFDSFLKGDDYDGWKSGRQPRVRLTLREGDAGVDDPERELSFPQREEHDWPLPSTQYTKMFLTSQGNLSTNPVADRATYTYDAMKGDPINFTYTARERLEITGHPVAHLTISSSAFPDKAPPSDIDIFLTLRKLDVNGNEVFFTGTMGDAVPIVKGWLRVSLRAVNTQDPRNREWLPYRDYYRSSLQDVEPSTPYEVDVELWPTNVVLSKGEKLVFEIAGHDTQGVGRFQHSHPEDRKDEIFAGLNTVQVGGEASYVVLPVIPSRDN